MTKKAQYWSAHLVAIESEGITTKAYAQREGLSATSLYYWRKRFKAEATGGVSTSRQLVPVQVGSASAPVLACTLTLAPGVHLDLPQLPDPHWLAALMSATGGR